MSRPRVYLAEDGYGAVAVGVGRRAFDVETTIEAGNEGAPDESQLDYAVSESRVLVTFNRGDFARIHGERVAAARSHPGIVVSRQAGVGAVVKALARFLASHDARELIDRLVWLRVPGPQDGS